MDLLFAAYVVKCKKNIYRGGSFGECIYAKKTVGGVAMPG